MIKAFLLVLNVTDGLSQLRISGRPTLFREEILRICKIMEMSAGHLLTNISVQFLKSKSLGPAFWNSDPTSLNFHVKEICEWTCQR